MRYLIVYSLLCLIGLHGRAQETFFTFLGDASWGYHVSVLDDKYVVAGFGAISFGNDALFFHDVSLEGEYLSTSYFNVDTVTETEIRWKGYEKSTSRGVHAVGQLVYQDSLQAFYFRFKEDFSDTLYTLPPFDIGSYGTRFDQVLELGQDSLLILGTYQTTLFQTEILLLCMDTLGNTHWQNNVAVQGEDLFPVDILPTEDGGFILTAIEYVGLGNSGFDDEIHSIVYKLDELGNVFAQRKPGNYEVYWTEPGGTILRDDGGFITFWCDSYIISTTLDDYNPQWTIRFAIYDQFGGLLSEGDFLEFLPTTESSVIQGYFYDMRDIIKLEDGNILISGDNFREGFLMKVTQDGEYIWHRTFSLVDDLPNDPGFAQTTLNTTVPLEDGGFLCPGEFFSFNSPDFPNGKAAALLLKLDEYGCLEPGCHLVDGVQEFTIYGVLSVFPNPTSGNFILEIPEGISKGNVEIMDLLGNRVQEIPFQGDSSLRIQLLGSAGIYILKLNTEQGVFTARIVKE
jgi:hypothetical protein